jgi:hypothetical protein
MENPLGDIMTDTCHQTEILLLRGLHNGFKASLHWHR